MFPGVAAENVEIARRIDEPCKWPVAILECAMPFDEQIVNRMRRWFADREVDFYEKKMFSGVCFMVDDKMCCGTHIDKTSGESLLLARVGEEVATREVDHELILPMTFTGRTMKDFVFVTETAIADDKALAQWLQLCLDYNPYAKKSKK